MGFVVPRSPAAARSYPHHPGWLLTLVRIAACGRVNLLLPDLGAVS